MSDLRPVEELSLEEAAEELRTLAGTIAEANRDYHQKDAPRLPDADYDALKRRNAEIEARYPELRRADSPSDQVGAAPAEGFAKVRHVVPMLSLENAFEDAEVVEFDARVRRFLGLSGRSRWPSPPSRRSMACRCRFATRRASSSRRRRAATARPARTSPPTRARSTISRSESRARLRSWRSGARPT